MQRNEKHGVNIATAKRKHKNAQIAFFIFMLVTVAASIAGIMTQKDWPLYFLPPFFITYLWSASAIRHLANSLNRNGLFFGWVAILLPVAGALVGYYAIIRTASKVIMSDSSEANLK